MSKYAFLLAVAIAGTAFGARAEEPKTDWLDTYNRSVFNFNYQLDKYTLKPVAEGYRAVTSQDIRNRVNSALFNVMDPVSSANHVLQGSAKKSAISLARFLINSTLGLAGTFDVASGWGLKREVTGFDQTLATWCVPDGPFFMVPLVGPTTPRAFTGFMVNGSSNPIYLGFLDSNRREVINWTYTGVDAIAARERSLDFLNDLEKNSVDFYTTVTSAYMQNRQMLNQMCKSAPQETKASYDFDFDAEDEE